jgi:hypothetical protein
LLNKRFSYQLSGWHRTHYVAQAALVLAILLERQDLDRGFGKRFEISTVRKEKGRWQKISRKFASVYSQAENGGVNLQQ